jgi:hypothetical protein
VRFKEEENNMGIANDIKNLNEDIVASYDARIHTIGTIVKENQALAKNTHTMLKGFSSEHKERSVEQAGVLDDFMADLTKNVGVMIEGFQEDHKKMETALKASLKKSTKDIETYVRNKLKDFSDVHAGMSIELKKDLAKYVADVVSGTQELLTAFHEEREQMVDHWQAMSAVMAKKRGFDPVEVNARSEAKTGKEKVEKTAASKAGKARD